MHTYFVLLVILLPSFLNYYFCLFVSVHGNKVRSRPVGSQARFHIRILGLYRTHILHLQHRRMTTYHKFIILLLQKYVSLLYIII